MFLVHHARMAVILNVLVKNLAQDGRGKVFHEYVQGDIVPGMGATPRTDKRMTIKIEQG